MLKRRGVDSAGLSGSGVSTELSNGGKHKVSTEVANGCCRREERVVAAFVVRFLMAVNLQEFAVSCGLAR
jgi:hypothetical protein